MEKTIKINILGDLATKYKQLQVLDAKMYPIREFWTSEGNAVVSVPKGIYTVRMILPSGKREEHVAVVQSRAKATISFNKKPPRPRRLPIKKTEMLTSATSPEEKLLVKIFGDQAYLNYDVATGEYLTVILWSLNNGIWNTKFLGSTSDMTRLHSGIEYAIEPLGDLQFLELSENRKPSQFVGIPASPDTRCRILKSRNPLQPEFEYDVTVTFSDQRSQAMLSLLNGGDISRVKDLWLPNQAERMLQEKMRNTIGAAIGGYYLLKTRELGRMHDWAANLANWFPWFPDGRIIFAWQQILLSESDTEPLSRMPTIRRNLLQATHEPPLFTEGLRLLYEGLSMCSSLLQNSEEVDDALLKVRKLLASSDRSKPTTTFTGGFPNHPFQERPIVIGQGQNHDMRQETRGSRQTHQNYSQHTKMKS